MALAADRDKDIFWWRIRGDPYIQYLMGIEGFSDTDSAKYILKQRENTGELTDKSRYIFIFNQPSIPAIGPFEKTIMQIDVLMPSSKQKYADPAMEQIVALCGGAEYPKWTVGGREIDEITTLGNLTAASGYYRCGTKFTYYTSTVTEAKKAKGAYPANYKKNSLWE